MESTLEPQSSTTAASPVGLSGTEDVYRSVSRSAVASLLLGILGLTSFGSPFLLVVSILGLLFAGISMIGFRKFPDELLGKPMAIIGGLVCLLTLVGAPAYHAYIYATEVPEGYQRISFSALMSDKDEPDQPTVEAMQLDGEPIFIKGYIHPTSMESMSAKKFVIVPDLGTCCFGGQPPLTHMVEVTLLGDQYARKSMRKQRLAGTLRVNPNLKQIEGLTGVYYQLRADVLK